MFGRRNGGRCEHHACQNVPLCSVCSWCSMMTVIGDVCRRTLDCLLDDVSCAACGVARASSKTDRILSWRRDRCRIPSVVLGKRVPWCCTPWAVQQRNHCSRCPRSPCPLSPLLAAGQLRQQTHAGCVRCVVFALVLRGVMTSRKLPGSVVQ